MAIRWDIEPRCKIDIWSFTGLNFSGNKCITRISARGKVFGDEIEGDRLKSIGLMGYHGVQITLISSPLEQDWEHQPWRTIRLMPGYTFTSKEGGYEAVQVPDLDVLSNFDDIRAYVDTTYPQVELPSEGTTWTFGHKGTLDLKCNIRAIRIERFDP